MSQGFIKILRDSQELFLEDKQVFDFMMLVAFRARWKETSINANGTKVGEAFVGRDDVKKILGWGERTYINVKKRVEQKYKLATCKGSNQGTIVKLLDSRFCNLNIENDVEQKVEQNNSTRVEQGSSKGRATGHLTKNKKEEWKKETTTSADAHDDADFSYDPLKAKAMLEEFWNSCGQTESQKVNYLSKGIGHCFAALQYISTPPFVINKTAIAAFVWAFRSKPWLEKANQPKLMTNRERVEQHFFDGQEYNKAICTINAQAISFHRGMKMGGANFDDKTFMANFSKVLESFGIENPFKIKLDNVKEA